MPTLLRLVSLMLSCSCMFILASCATSGSPNNYYYSSNTNYGERLPQHVDTGNKRMVLIDPNVHAWGAYDADGSLVRAGLATAGGAVCPSDAVGESDCRTASGTFHITAIGGADCYSKKYPQPYGGGLMPFCMYFHGGQALHGSPDDIVVEDNISHGCVRMQIPEAEWMVNNFAHVGTKIVVVPYS